MAKPALGRGLGALLGGAPPIGRPPQPSPAPTPASAPQESTEGSREQVRLVPLNRIRPCAFQPRKEFAPEALKELADSIREQGIVQPLIVRERNQQFELIAGERRWRAAQLVGLQEVPVLVRDADDRAVLELALIENLQRENLNPIEEAQGYAQLIGQFHLTQEEVATKVGKGRVVVANALRLLKLPSTVQTYLREGRLSVGHAKVILGLETQKLQQGAAERILKDGLSVRQTEVLASRLQAQAAGGATPSAHTPLTRDAHVTALENKIRERLGTKVQLRYAKGKGSLDIAFFSDDELERILDILGVKAE